LQCHMDRRLRRIDQMRFPVELATILVCCGWSAASCPPASTQPASRPTTTTAPCEPVDPTVMKILKDQEAAAGKYATIRANLEMEIIDRRVGDSEKRTGWLVYCKGDKAGNPRFRIHFDTLKQSQGPTRKEQVDWAFDGYWLSKAQPRIKQILRFQVVAEGQKAEPVRLGKGPLPLPFGQKAEEVLTYYDASTRAVTEDEPKGTVYLKLNVKKAHYREMDSVRLEVWIDTKTQLPVKLVSRDKKKKVTTVIFTNVKTNVEIDARKMFELPLRPGWTEEKRPLEKPAPR